jgi:hypothetical protein
MEHEIFVYPEFQGPILKYHKYRVLPTFDKECLDEEFICRTNLKVFISKHQWCFACRTHNRRYTPNDVSCYSELIRKFEQEGIYLDLNNGYGQKIWYVTTDKNGNTVRKCHVQTDLLLFTFGGVSSTEVHSAGLYYPALRAHS